MELNHPKMPLQGIYLIARTSDLINNGNFTFYLLDISF